MHARKLLHHEELPSCLGGFTISVFIITQIHAKRGRIFEPGDLVLRYTKGGFSYEL